MKTPREILFERHNNASPNLDRIRREIIDGLATSRRSIAATVWRELIVSARRGWICLGAGWVVVIALNVMAGGEASVNAVKSGPVNPDSVIALQRQEQLMARLAESDTSPAEAPERRPRSEVRVEYKVV